MPYLRHLLCYVILFEDIELYLRCLKNAVKKVANSIQKDDFKKRLELLNINQKKLQKIAVPYKSDYVIIDLKNIAFFEADRMYTHIKLIDGKNYTASKKLSHYQKLLSESNNFIRIHRSWMVNTDHIFIYSKKEKNIELKNGIKIPISKSYKESFEDLF